MARDGNGNYNLPEAPFVFDTVIDEAAVNNNFSDIGSALSQSLSKDGQTVPTGNLPMGGQRHTGVGNASARNDYPSTGQVQDGAFVWCGTAGGTANALTLTPSPAITAYASGQKFWFRAGANNTDAATAVVSGLPAIPVQTGGSPLVSGSITSGLYYQVLFVSNTFQISRIAPSRIGHALMQASTQEAAQAAIGLTATIGQIPVGGIVDYGGVTIPSNFLIPAGQNVLRAQWPELFAEYQIRYGSGDGSTTFGLPDLRGRVVAGTDNMGGLGNANRLTAAMGSGALGGVGGSALHTLIQAELAPHGHTINITRLEERRPRVTDNPPVGEWTVWSLDSPPNTSNTSVTGSGQGHLNVQPTMVLQKLIFAGEEVAQP